MKYVDNLARGRRPKQIRIVDLDQEDDRPAERCVIIRPADGGTIVLAFHMAKAQELGAALMRVPGSDEKVIDCSSPSVPEGNQYFGRGKE